MLGEGLASFLDDQDKLRNTALTITGIAIGIFTARTSIGIVGRFVEARLGKPSLVRETSRMSATQLVQQPVSSIQRLLGVGVKEHDAMKGIVLEESLDDQLRKIAVSTANTKKNRAPFRHLLLHGKSFISSYLSYTEIFAVVCVLTITQSVHPSLRPTWNRKDHVCKRPSPALWLGICHFDWR